MENNNDADSNPLMHMEVDSLVDSGSSKSDSNSPVSSEQSDIDKPNDQKSNQSVPLTDNNDITDDEETRKQKYFLDQQKKKKRSKKEDPKLMTYWRYKKAVVDYMEYSGATQEEVIALFGGNILRSKSELSKWKTYVKGVTNGKQDLIKPDKKNKLHSLVYKAYREKREKFLPVTGNDLLRIAKDIADKEKIRFAGKNFIASNTWLHNFKVRHRIVSRKITNTVYSVRVRNKEAEGLEKAEFRRSIREKIIQFQPENVYNADESGYQYEFVNKRTLETKGTSKVFVYAAQKTTSRKSYTIMPTISAAGELLPRLLIVLKETNHLIGSHTAKTIFTSPNLFITARASGKTKDTIVNDWFERVFLPAVGTKSLLMLDSSSTRKKRDLEKVVLESGQDKVVEFVKIPGGTTDELQPCDQYFFLAWKRYVKEMQREIRIYRKEFHEYDRDNVLRIQAFTHNQLSCRSWKQAIVKSWADCGYLERDRDDWFTNAFEWAFRDYDLRHRRQETCEVYECAQKTLIRCLRCKRCLCLDHCFWETENRKYIHYHNEDGRLVGVEEFDRMRPDKKEMKRYVEKKKVTEKTKPGDWKAGRLKKKIKKKMAELVKKKKKKKD